MPDRPAVIGLSELALGVRLIEAPSLAHEVVTRLPRPTDPRPVSVTDLLAPRRAFWRRQKGPAPLPLERELRLEQGRAWHRRLGDAVAADGRLEVRVRRGGLAARIDLLADVPVEVKSAPEGQPGSVPVDWPDQVAQLALYCALAGSPTGRLVHLTAPERGPPTVAVGELRFRDLAATDAEARRREEALRGALAVGSPAQLGRCPWYDASCEYRTAGLCDCRGTEPPEDASLLGQVDARLPRPEIAERWTSALRGLPPPTNAPTARYRDLLYPRRTYFDRTARRSQVSVPPRPSSAPLDLYERMIAALEAGPVGDLHRLVPVAEAPEEEVLAWRGSPCLVRSSRTRSGWGPEELRSRFPQYLVELGFRAALTGSASATLIVGHETPAVGEPLVQAFRLEFGETLARLADAWGERRRGLEGALARGAPGELPSCPGWMAPDCPYRGECACAGEAGRSQR